ncbi:MAG: D-alanyl-D-alanine carboxypeptidase serine-type, family [Planctomycetota bacterium]|nr:D-alanyl-D-alanine carboxypeptidase serine-type, family [Planctomycetota bacterium]
MSVSRERSGDGRDGTGGEQPMRRFLIGAVLVIAVGSGSRAADPAMERVEAVLGTPAYKTGHWGLLVVDAKTGETVYEKNPDQLFCPASVTKLFSTSAAMSDLGADYRFKTPVVRRGDVGTDGTLKGDLILVAGGDLSFGGRTGPDGALLFEDNDHSYAAGSFKATLVNGNPRAGLEHLAKGIKESGIKTITGDVLVDDRLFEPAASTGSGPSRVVPIIVNDNVVDVVVTPASKVGEPAVVTIKPETAFVSFDAQVTTAAEKTTASIEVAAIGPRRFTVRGRLPVGHRPVVKIYEVEEPAAFARTLFLEALRDQGIKFSASPLGDNAALSLPARPDVAKLPIVAEYTSPPFKEYAKVILKVSHNLHASTLPLIIAAHHGETTLDAGLRREGALLKGLGVDISSIAFGGGAGGARADLVTPRATVTLLQAMAKRPDFSAFEAALPVLGRDGTLSQAVAPDSPARGHARAKTGTYWLNNGLNGEALLTSKALAGYMETASGRPLVFAFFVNNIPLKGGNVNDSTAAVGKLLGSLCEVFYADAAASPAPGTPKANE